VNRLHSVLAVIAALLAAGAGVVDRGTIGERRHREGIEGLEFISAPELAGRIMRGDDDLRVFDLRPMEVFEQFHVPGARHATPGDLANERLSTRLSLVLYGDDRTALFEALRVLRRQNHRSVRVLREGISEWLGRVQEPRLAIDATAGERAEFERAAEMSRFFGGVPRAGVPRENVPQGYWTGRTLSDELLIAAATQAVATIRRRGC
jgi:rhodanese-related sulfurtransferase